jgi:small-conductance mechanosensitive channel
MDLSFKELHGTEVDLGHLRQSKLINAEYIDSRRRIVKRIGWLLALSAVAYLLSTLSVTTLLILGGMVTALIALATGVCIYAQNNTPFV